MARTASETCGLGTHPFWLEGLPSLPRLPEEPPAATDVAIIGAGCTGLNCALETVRGGRATLVLDASDPGSGCSTRNGGQVGTSIKPSLATLATRYGVERARAIRAAGREALAFIVERIRSEAIDCDFRRCGRFRGAHTPWHFRALEREAEELRAEGIAVEIVPRAEQRRELGTDAYFGGLVFPEHGALHPAKYQRGLLERVIAAGGTVVGHCPVQAIARDGKAFVLATPRGRVRARTVVVATNGYSGRLIPWLTRRILPVESTIIATEPLPPELVAHLFPTDRVAGDTCRVISYYRTSPDRKRVLFGGRVLADRIAPATAAERLRRRMCQIFPELEPYRVTHVWSGTVAWSFDELPHIGQYDGLWYALGYCGSGVSLASWLGSRLGLKLLGRPEGRTPLDDLPHPTRPLYSGRPWFLPAVVGWYRLLDAIDGWRAARWRRRRGLN